MDLANLKCPQCGSSHVSLSIEVDVKGELLGRPDLKCEACGRSTPLSSAADPEPALPVAAAQKSPHHWWQLW